VAVSTMPNTATAHTRAGTILAYINGITLSGRTLTYPSSSSAEERAIRWLVEDDLGTAVDDEQSLRQRYVLGTLWFLQPTPTTIGLGSAEYAVTWTTNIDECEWFDVFCDDGRVTFLDFGDNNVRGQIPNDLGLLTDLTTIWMSQNVLTGTIPLSIGDLTALTYLDLWKNKLIGTIPSSFQSLTALTNLQLAENQLFGTIPSSLGSLTALEFLHLNNNQFNGAIPSSLGALTALFYLALEENALTGSIPSSLGAMTALNFLFLLDNQLNGSIPSSLGALTVLESLHVSGNALTGTIPSSLGTMTALTSLFLSDNQLVGSVPFCNSNQALAYLVADCAEVSCTCCTNCCPAAFGVVPVSEYCNT
jgi:Leucine-rich repeat (LRR) protein